MHRLTYFIYTVIEAMSVTANISRDITFPNKASDSAYNTSNSIEIPANFISHRSSVTGKLPIYNYAINFMLRIMFIQILILYLL